MRKHRSLLVASVTLLGLLGASLAFVSYRYSAVALLRKVEGNKESRSIAELAPMLQQRLREIPLLQAAARESSLGTAPEQLQTAVTVRAGDSETLEISVRRPVAAEAVALTKALAVKALSIAAEVAADSGKTMLPVYENKLTEAETQLKECSARWMALQGEMGSAEREASLEDHWKERDELETRLAENESLSRAVAIQLTNLQGEILSHHPAVLSAKQNLDRALLRYTEDHPKVEELKLTLAAVQARVREHKDEVDPEIALNGNSLAQGLYAKFMSLRGEEKVLAAKKGEMSAALGVLDKRIKSFPENQARLARAKAEYHLWETTYQQLLAALNKQQLLASTAMLPLSLVQNPSDPVMPWAQRWGFAATIGLVAALLGGAGLGLGISWRACRDPRVKSETELLAASSLPVLGALPDLQTMSVRDQEKWAFQTFSKIKTSLAPGAGSALVCGFTSSRPGEGRSTWIRLLAGTARKQGYQVLVIATVPNVSGTESALPPSDLNSALETPTVTLFDGPHPVALTTESLSQAQVFAVPCEAAWSLENRLQWKQGLEELAKGENRVILVEFPPASEPETVLLANNFPNLIWVCGQDRTTVAELQAQMETLGASQARLVGTVLNFAQA